MSSFEDYLVPKEASVSILLQDCQELLTAHQVALGCADALILQARFTNNLLTTLPEDQALAARNALTFKSGDGYGFASSSFTSLKSISITVINLLEGLIGTAVDLDNDTPNSSSFNQSLVDFRTAVQTLIETCTNASPDSDSVLAHSNGIHANLGSLMNRIQQDYTRISTAVKEVEEVDAIGTLHANQLRLQSELADVNSEIAKGAATTIPAAFNFGFEFGKQVQEDSTKGMIAGMAMTVVGGVEEVSEFNEKVQALYDKQKDIGDKIFALGLTIAEDKDELATLTLIAAQISEFYNRIKIINALTGSINTQMSDWKNQLRLLSDHDAPPRKNFYAQQVSNGIKFWNNLHDELERYLRIMAFS